jgi:methionyl-tRNA synthetase
MASRISAMHTKKSSPTGFRVRDEAWGRRFFFLTGLDEHGQKVQQTAIAEGKTPQAYCDERAADWKAFAKKLELTNDILSAPPSRATRNLSRRFSRSFMPPDIFTRRLVAAPF